MRMEQRQNVQQSVLRSKCQSRAHVMGRQTDARLGQWDHLRPRRTARGQQDKGVVAPPAANPLLTARAGTEPTRLNAPGPSSGRGDRSMTGMPRVCATPRLAESMSARVNSAATRKSREIALPFVSGEARVERHADRTSCDRDDRQRSLWSVRQYHRHAIASTYTEAS